MHSACTETLAALDAKSPSMLAADAAAAAAAAQSVAVDAAMPSNTPSDMSVEGSGPSDTVEHVMMASVEMRRRLRRRILESDIAGACSLCEETYPGLLERHPHVKFLLQCQAFIELVRSSDALKALAYAQTHLAPYRVQTEERYSKLLQEVVSLLA